MRPSHDKLRGVKRPSPVPMVLGSAALWLFAAVVGCELPGTGGELVEVEWHFRSSAPTDRPLVVETSGEDPWTVEVLEARLLVGPAYLFAPPPNELAVVDWLLRPATAFAHAGDDNTLRAKVVSELLDQFAIDLLDPQPRSLQTTLAESGPVDTINIVLDEPRFELAGADGPTRGGHAFLRGIATRERSGNHEEIRFSAVLRDTVPEGRIGRRVESLPVDGRLDQGSTIELRADPSVWVRHMRFDEWIGSREEVRIPEPSRLHNAWYLGLRDSLRLERSDRRRAHGALTPTRTSFMRLERLTGFTLSILVLASCGDSEGGSTISVNAFAGEEARTGITAAQMADDYTVRYDHVILELERFTAQTTTGEDAELDPSPVLVELVPNGAPVFEFDGVEARRWDESGYASAPPPEGVRLANDVDPTLADRMVSEGWSQLITGTLVAPDGAEFPFEIGFPVEVVYRSCSSGRDGTLGIVTPVNGVVEVELTWHLTHLFFDSFAEDSSLRAEPFAAVYDGVNPISLDDLRGQLLADLRDREGDPLTDDVGNPVLYIPPAGGAETLREHVLAARFGHFNGLEGFCMTELTVLED